MLCIDEFTQHSGDQGPTIKFMNGTDAKDIVIQRFVWNEAPKRKNDESENEKNETCELENEEEKQEILVIDEKEDMKESKDETPKKKRKKSKSHSSKKKKKRKKSKSPKKKRGNVIDLMNDIELEPPTKRRKISL